MGTVARIYIVRHGETEENRRGIIQGQMDTSLNATGIEEAKEVGKALEKVPFAMAYSSDLSRAVKTAEAIVTHHPHLQIEKQEALRERYLGDFQGKHSPLSLLSKPSPTAESIEGFVARAISWWNKIILHKVMSLAIADAPLNILVVSHGGFIRNALVRTLVKSGKIQCGDGVRIGKCFNTSVSIIEVDSKGKATLIQFGDISHLELAVVETNADEIE